MFPCVLLNSWIVVSKIAKVWDRLNIHPTKASECEDDIANFLKLFDVKDITNCIIK